MGSPLNLIPPRVQALAMRALIGLPEPVLRVLAGRPIVVDGQRLAPGAQLILRVQRLVETGFSAGRAPGRARAAFEQLNRILNAAWQGRVDTREFSLPGPAGPLRARLYEPPGRAAQTPLLVFFHGGGWAIGSLDSHDMLGHFFAEYAGVRVLSVEYRLAPEHPFPAAVEDAQAAYRYAVAHAEELGADPGAIAVGGDSAGGNLAGVVAATVEPRPAFALMLYPATDATTVRPSRRLFAKGFFLGEEQIIWFRGQYVPDASTYADPRFSVLRTEDLSGFPPTYIATAGFDPLRDEGEAFAERLREVGAPVALQRQRELFHGFANLVGIDRRCRCAMMQAAGALRAGLAFGRGQFETVPQRPLE
ncbi:alpha/beta hydrolase [Longimycelium tulufanense]|uniref:Alpha/beta hydrolase n=1 Tax=Longimycelium tulufanense TaxID=907463 RepID=A0A8J3FW85_9PSEU|nr:alpha/beta hydrolase [Longimycelium tulufanense]GGM57619.1 alpha/beta hydrolase [Longimycelium tulufanense]